MKKIIAAVDGSECSYRALEHAAKLAKGLDVELTVVIVILFVVGRSDVYVGLNDEEISAMQDRAKEIILAAGHPRTDMLVEKSRDIAFTIVETAIDNDAGLIVMGASGKGGFKTFLIGSVSKEVLKKSACPVTIVH